MSRTAAALGCLIFVIFGLVLVAFATGASFYEFGTWLLAALVAAAVMSVIWRLRRRIAGAVIGLVRLVWRATVWLAIVLFKAGWRLMLAVLLLALWTVMMVLFAVTSPHIILQLGGDLKLGLFFLIWALGMVGILLRNGHNIIPLVAAIFVEFVAGLLYTVGPFIPAVGIAIWVAFTVLSWLARRGEWKTLKFVPSWLFLGFIATAYAFGLYAAGATSSQGYDPLGSFMIGGLFLPACLWAVERHLKAKKK